MKLNLSQFFTFMAISKVLEAAAVIKSTIMDDLFPETVRDQLDSPLVPLSELRETINCAPVVTRGGDAYPIAGDELTNHYIEPLPVRLLSVIGAQDFNNLKIMDMGARERWAQRKILQARKTTRLTIEALCAQAVFDGEISYPLLQNNGAFAKYNVSFGGAVNVHAVPAEEKWNHANATLKVVLLMLNAMSTKLDQDGYGGEKITYVGGSAWATLLGLIDNIDPKKSRIPARINDDGTVLVGSHRMKEMSEVWKNPETGASVTKVPTGEIRMVSKGHTRLVYAALDDLDANLKPLPLFVKPIQKQAPSQLQIWSESKPLPASQPGAVIKAAVLAEGE